MDEIFDFEEATRNCDQRIAMFYYDEALTNRNFILKLRKLLNKKSMSLETFRIEIGRLNSKLKFEQMKMFKNHFPINADTK